MRTPAIVKLYRNSLEPSGLAIIFVEDSVVEVLLSGNGTRVGLELLVERLPLNLSPIFSLFHVGVGMVAVFVSGR